MISSPDFVQLPYTADLSSAGLLRACQTLAHIPGSGGTETHEAFRRAVAATAADLAFRRYLSRNDIGFETRLTAPFVDAVDHAVMTGDRALELKTFLISHRQQVGRVEAEPDLVLKAPAMVPVDRALHEGLHSNDIYIFALVMGEDHVRHDGGRRHEPVGPAYWLHILPPAWRRPRNWSSVGPLIITLEAGDAVDLEVGGLDISGNRREIQGSLTPRAKWEFDVQYSAVQYLHALQPPAGRITLALPAHTRSHVVLPSAWQDAWVLARSIWLLGWLPYEQYGARARIIPAGARTFQFDRTKTKNFGVEVAELRPMARLIEKLR